MEKAFLTISIITIVACTPERRFARLLAKNPTLIDQQDTAYRYDTVFTPEYRNDTIFRTVAGKRDTFIINLPGGGNTTIYTNADKSELQAATYLPADTAVNATVIISQYVDAYEARLQRAIRRYIRKAALLAVLALALIIGLIYFKQNFSINKK